jgi:hypothetical protein
MCSYTAFTTHYRGGAPRRRGATRKTRFHSAAQARAWADGDFDADHGLAFATRDGARAPPGSLEPGVRPNRGGGGGCTRALAVYKPPPPKGHCEGSGAQRRSCFPPKQKRPHLKAVAPAMSAFWREKIHLKPKPIFGVPNFACAPLLSRLHSLRPKQGRATALCLSLLSASRPRPGGGEACVGLWLAARNKTKPVVTAVEL